MQDVLTNNTRRSRDHIELVVSDDSEVTWHEQDGAVKEEEQANESLLHGVDFLVEVPHQEHDYGALDCDDQGLTIGTERDSSSETNGTDLHVHEDLQSAKMNR